MNFTQKFFKQILLREIDNPIGITDALSNISTFDYDELSRLVQATDPKNHCNANLIFICK